MRTVTEVSRLTDNSRSSSRRRASRTILAGALGVLACLLCAALPAAAGAVSYVAMGDSYTSGPGILPYAAGAPSECGQSSLNYPHLVAAALELTLTDVSCGGASTANFKIAQFPGSQEPQFDALSASTEVVSLGMGGNDHDVFGTLVQGCSETDTTTPGKAPCKAKYEAFVTKSFEEDRVPAEEALREIKLIAPKAKVFVVGYPDITPSHGTCPTALPWTEGDLRWFRNTVQKHGNAMIKAGAKANGAIFVDTFKASEGHDLCKPVGTRWIEPLINSLTGVPVHPNAAGEQQDATDLERAMSKAGIH